MRRWWSYRPVLRPALEAAFAAVRGHGHRAQRARCYARLGRHLGRRAPGRPVRLRPRLGPPPARRLAAVGQAGGADRRQAAGAPRGQVRLQHEPQPHAADPHRPGERARRAAGVRAGRQRRLRDRRRPRRRGRRRRAAGSAPTHVEHFAPTITTGRNRYIWLGTSAVLGAFTFAFERTAAGWLWAYGYPSTGGTSTFVVECAPSTWTRLGLDRRRRTRACGCWSRCSRGCCPGTACWSRL